MPALIHLTNSEIVHFLYKNQLRARCLYNTYIIYIRNMENSKTQVSMYDEKVENFCACGVYIKPSI